jgi:ubiquinone biosynthesis protein
LELRAVVDRWLGRVRRGQLPGLTWLIGMLDEATRSSRLRVGPNMMMFRKSLHTLEGVVRDLGAEGAEIEKPLLREFVLQFAQEWPERWFSWPTSRAFATRLSNMDITETILSSPLAVARFWQAHWHDVLRKRPRATAS